MVRKRQELNIALLAKDLSLISEKYANWNIVGNTFLKIGKPTTENLRPYILHNGRFKLVKLLISLTLFIPLLVGNALREIARAIYFKSENSLLKKESNSSDFLFLSHYTQAPQNHLEDNYFGSIPFQLNSTKKRSAIFLLNHTRRKGSAISAEFDEGGPVNYYVNPKAIKLQELIVYFKGQFPGTLHLLMGAIGRSQLDLRQRLLAVDASIKQFSRPTFAAIILIANLERVLKQIEPKHVILTFEGHSFEVLALRMIHKKFPGIKVSLFQYAPIVKDQFGLIGALRELGSSDMVLTTGPAVKNYFEKEVHEIASQIRILGSPKALKVIESEEYKFNSSTKNSVCLFAPEASREAFDEMLHLASACSLALTEKKFILRLHPAFHFDKKKMFLTVSKFPSNLTLSNNTLEEDLLSSGFCVYRSTAVAIQGLIYGVRPIHFSSISGDGLDPLAITSLEHERLSQELELISYLKWAGTTKASSVAPSLAELRSAYKDYFYPLNSRVLNKL